MAKVKQLKLIKDPRPKTKLWWITKQKVYGGSLKYRKVRRPFDSKMLTHAVFKARLGKAIWFTKSEATISNIARLAARRYGVRIKEIAVHRDHIHMLFYTSSRASQIRFLRLFSGNMGRLYRKIRCRAGLWVARPFTRLVGWGRRSLAIVHSYIRRNRHEVMGFIDYRPRSHSLSKFIALWERGLAASLPG